MPLPRRALRALVLLAVLAALAAGTSGDVVSVAQRIDPHAVFAAGSRASAAPASADSPDALAVGSADPAPSAPATTATAPTTTTTTSPLPLAWTLFAGGDVLMDRSEAEGRDPFASLIPELSEADLALVNVEMAIAERGAPEEGKEFAFRAPPSAAETLAAAGVDVANLGNNHALDFGPDALLETITHLRTAGVTTTGAGGDPGEAHAPATIELGGGAGDRGQRISVAVLGASDVVPAGWVVGAAGAGRPGIATTRGGALVDAVRAAAAAHDVVIVTVHWGVELAGCPHAAQVALGDRLLDAGAAAVIGHHPHVLQPIEERGAGAVAYSLGNFVWHPRSGPQTDTGVLEIRFSGADYDGFTFHPHRLDGRGEPEPAGTDDVERIVDAVDPSRC